ncbi:1-deoxy-D-xylulose-5-phosphate reductoisomerase [Paenibacillus contaminans]|uniref:1-deoxy-D-xylulose 5-phosphate reductoisomerase n=1 Tax=Paenibacillus contaminans TaxID=450362 RepID=A0A329MRY5_9BACL|nr:1-deoxy-D-xylulose-5-phosphate reductoisomerase [Paenibacillus contaminans]RAV22741.1 1-deoxy-D-xylulose-5-phosphate reductoisomerase [Paenibacillus contaminans]
MKKISILGSTGSIGTQTLDVIAHDPERYSVEALAAGGNIKLLAEQIRRFRPKKVSVSNKDHAEQLKHEFGDAVQLYWGHDGLLETAAGTDADLVVTAMVGSVGLEPTLAAIEAGKQIGLANKETLVTAGHLVTALAAKRGVKLLPIDSEHSAIFQCLNGERQEEISKLILTASGGSFRDRTREELGDVTVEQALSHPNWSMGAKITIDSATMVNKGLEVIEAHWLFHMPYDRIEVMLHPQSVIHSMVEFVDNSVIAQLGNPDMRVPIQYALTYPARFKTPSEPLDLSRIGSLDFRKMDEERFPCLKMAFACGRAGGTATTVFNAANEVAVSRFLQGEIRFLQIEDIIEQVLERHELISSPDLEQIIHADGWARITAGGIACQ